MNRFSINDIKEWIGQHGKRLSFAYKTRPWRKNEVDKSSKNCDSALEKLNLCVERDIDLSGNHEFEGKRILLLDDLYQSGVSMQFTAMKLYLAGANEIYGLSIVKSLSNS